MSCSGWGGSEAARQIREAFDLTYRSLTMNNRAEVPEGAFRGSPRRCGGFSIFVLCPAPYDNAESSANARQGGGDRRVQKKTHA